MRQLFGLLLLLFIVSCKEEHRWTLERYDDGKVKREYVYPDKKNREEYTIIEYFQNGKISFQGTVENDKFVDAKLNYYDNGAYREIDSITIPCDLDLCCCDGKVLHYYSNGKLDQTYENRNGLHNGLLTIYEDDSTGTVYETMMLKDGKRNGPFTIYYKSGKIFSTGTYKNDTLVDFVYFLRENGDTLKYFYHYKGKQDFPAKKWLANGQIFYATYPDTTYDQALFRWTDKNGTELKREIVKPTDDGHFIIPE